VAFLEYMNFTDVKNELTTQIVGNCGGQGCIKGFRSDIRYSEQPLIFGPYPDQIEKYFQM